MADWMIAVLIILISILIAVLVAKDEQDERERSK